MKNIAGKTILITGAAMGMGKMYAQLAVQEKAAAVVLWDINEEALTETAAGLTAAGGNVTTYVVDVADRAQIEKAAAQVRTDVGHPDIVFNNAGVVRGNSYFWETDNARDTEFTMKINSLAPMFIAREFLPGMIESGNEARLINVASAAGLTANPHGRLRRVEVGRYRLVGFGPARAGTGRPQPGQGDDGVSVLHQHRDVRGREICSAASDSEARGRRQ